MIIVHDYSFHSSQFCISATGTCYYLKLLMMVGGTNIKVYIVNYAVHESYM